MKSQPIVEQVLLTKRQAADAIASSERHIDRLTAAKLLSPIKRGRWVRFAVDDVKALREKLK